MAKHCKHGTILYGKCAQCEREKSGNPRELRTIKEIEHDGLMAIRKKAEDQDLLGMVRLKLPFIV